MELSKKGKTMKKSKNRAFTLAEVMIVLTVIGILSAILLPVAWHSTPDKNLLKFKKGYNTFSTVIREIVSNGEYYLPGDLSKKPDGTGFSDKNEDDMSWACNAMASVLSYKKHECFYKDNGAFQIKTDLAGYDGYFSVDNSADVGLGVAKMKEFIDASCIDTSGIYMHGPGTSYMSTNFNDSVVYVLGTDDIHYIDLAISSFFYDDSYKIFCIDIDGEGGVKPFGFGVRADGKIMTGARADRWLERDLNQEKYACCPKTHRQAYRWGSGATRDICDVGEEVCAE